MQLSRVSRVSRKLAVSERGIALLETLVALALLGSVGIAFLSGLATTSRAAIIADEQTTAESLARSQLEWAKKVTYTDNATEYSPAQIPAGTDYLNYSATITAEQLHNPDDGIQKITVTVKHSGKEVITLECYKVDR